MRAPRFVRYAVTAGVAAAALAVVPAFVSSSFASPALASSAPAAPTSVGLAAGNHSLSVSWTESTSGTLVFVATARTLGHLSKVCISKTDACTIGALVNGLVYNVTVVAKKLLVTSAPSGDVTALVGVPGAPRSVHAGAGKASASVSWSAPASRGVARVTGYMATAFPGGLSCSTAATLLTQAGRSCEIPGLSSGTAYTVTVTATNAFGTGLPSRAVSVTPS